MSKISRPTSIPTDAHESTASSASESYDEVSIQEQAIIREEWDKLATLLRNNLDYAAKFTAEGESYSELDEAGEVKVQQPTDADSVSAD